MSLEVAATTLTYDGLERLTAVSGPLSETFSLDAATNISSRTGPTATYSYDTANRLTSDGTTSYTWNGADRLIVRGADTSAYDPLGRMTSSTVSGTTRTFAYNGDGLLASATQGTTTNYLWDSATSPAPLLGAGTDKVVYGLGPLYGVRADATTYTFARDGLGSVRAEVDGSGAITKSFRYAAYGRTAQSVGTPTLFGYAGELADANGLIYLRARWYDPALGRFMSRDRFNGIAEQPSSLNGFGYTAARPTLLVDPLGLDPMRMWNWAYAIADVFADLDSPNVFRQSTAYVTVIASGVAIAALLVAGATAVGPATAARLAPPTTRLWPAPALGGAIVNGVEYTRHALERMAPVGLGGRGIPPSVVKNAIESGQKSAGTVAGTIRHVYDNVVVVTDETAQRVLTVWKTGR